MRRYAVNYVISYLTYLRTRLTNVTWSWSCRSFVPWKSGIIKRVLRWWNAKSNSRTKTTRSSSHPPAFSHDATRRDATCVVHRRPALTDDDDDASKCIMGGSPSVAHSASRRLCVVPVSARRLISAVINQVVCPSCRRRGRSAVRYTGHSRSSFTGRGHPPAELR